MTSEMTSDMEEERERSAARARQRLAEEEEDRRLVEDRPPALVSTPKSRRSSPPPIVVEDRPPPLVSTPNPVSTASGIISSSGNPNPPVVSIGSSGNPNPSGTIYMTQVEAADHVAKRMSLLQRWRAGDESAGQQLTMQERERGWGREKLDSVGDRRRQAVQRKEEKRLARLKMPSILESTEQQQQQ